RDLRFPGKPVVDVLPGISTLLELLHQAGLPLPGDGDALDVLLREGGDVHVQGDVAVRVVLEHETGRLAGEAGREAEVGVPAVRAERDRDRGDSQDRAFRRGGNGPRVQDVDAHVGPEVDA